MKCRGYSCSLFASNGGLCRVTGYRTYIDSSECRAEEFVLTEAEQNVINGLKPTEKGADYETTSDS